MPEFERYDAQLFLPRKNGNINKLLAPHNSAGAEERPSIEDIHQDDVRGLLAHGIPPFPYKVAKSLDPDIYRNIEYDAWNTIRRGERSFVCVCIST